MTIFKENKETGLSCGINDNGDLFLGDKESGYNLPYSEENKLFVLNDFEFYNNNK